MHFNKAQLKNAFSPIDVTLSGIMMLVSNSQLENELRPTVVTPSGMTYEPAFPAGHRISVVLSLLNKTPSSLE
jgi:hypothetical protein